MANIDEIENATAESNSTLLSSGNQILETTFYICVIACQVAIMLSMGAIITIQDIIEHFKRPVGVFIALLSQFVAMPASSYGLINLLQLPPTIALAAMILACCPGGSSSNLFTYFCDGDVPLSIMLTTISTILAMGFMPFNLWVYARQWEGSDQLKVPYENIAITLAWILIPLIFGMILNKFASKIANILSQVGSALGLIFIWIGVILQIIMFPEAFNKGWKLWLIAAAIPTGGFLLGYLLAFIARQKAKQRKTISLETGMQSISLGTTIVVTSFPKHMHGQMTPLLTMCGIYLNGAAVLLAIFVRLSGYFSKRKTAKITPIDVKEKNEKVICTISNLSNQ